MWELLELLIFFQFFLELAKDSFWLSIEKHDQFKHMNMTNLPTAGGKAKKIKVTGVDADMRVHLIDFLVIAGYINFPNPCEKKQWSFFCSQLNCNRLEIFPI